MHGTVVGHGSEDHKGQSYKMRVIMTGCTITKMKQHLRATPISVEDYLRKEMSNANRCKPIHCFAQINMDDECHNMEMEEKGIIPKTMQPPRHVSIEHSEKINKATIE